MYDTLITKGALTENLLAHRHFENCVFQNCDFSDVSITGVLFEDCRLLDCNLSSVDLRDSAWQLCHLENCKLIGLDWTRVNPLGFDVEFVNCNLSHSFFTGLKLKQLKMTECRLQGTVFEHCDLQGTQFINCDFTDAQFFQNNLEKAKFISPSNLVVNPAENRMRGAQFPLESLPGLLAHTGIMVAV